MSLFGKILGGVEIVAGAVLDAYSFGLAGNTLIAEGTLTLGQNTLGGSVGNFLRSGYGTALQVAVGLGSAAYGMLGNAAVAQAGDANATTSGFMQNVDLSQSDIQAMQSEVGNTMAADGLTPGEVNLANTAVDQATAADAAATGGVPGAAPTSVDSQLTANASQVAANNTNQAATAVNAGDAPEPGLDTTTSNPIQNETPVANTPAGATAQAPATATTAPSTGATPAATAATTASPGGVKGFLSAAGKMIEAHPNLAMIGGQAIAGYAQGAQQESMMNKEIAAQQWANMQWQNNPSEVQAMQAAAAQPITVPSGYLSRAQAVKNLMSGSSSQTGPVIGVQPGQPSTPTQVTAPAAPVPVGMMPGTVAPPGGVQATPNAPRGGVI